MAQSIWEEKARKVAEKAKLHLNRDGSCSYWSEKTQTWMRHVAMTEMSLYDLGYLALAEREKYHHRMMRTN